MTNTALPRPELHGEGTVTFRCAECLEPVSAETAFWSDGTFVMQTQPLVLTPETRTYHEEHAPFVSSSSA